MTERLKKDNFFAQGRRVCIIETEDNEDPMMDEKFVKKAMACSFRQKRTVEFTEKDLEGLQFAECTHPDKKYHPSVFCPVMIDRINQEPT